MRPKFIIERSFFDIKDIKHLGLWATFKGIKPIKL